MKATSNQPADTERLRFLLQGLLAPIRQADEDPSRLRIDSAGIAQQAWGDLVAEHPGIKHDIAWTAAKVIAGLEEVLGREPAEDEPQVAVAGDVAKALATWLDELFLRLRAIDPHAIEIAGLQVEGFDERAISEGLEMGLRLVTTILGDIRASRGAARPAKAKAKEEASC